MNVLQRLLVPTLEVCPRADLYVRLGPGTDLSTIDRCVRLDRGAEVGFDTYFGSFSAARWKASTGVGRVALELDLVGAVRAEVVLAHARRPERVLATAELASEGGASGSLELPAFDELDGVLAVRLRGLAERSEVRAGRWVTETMPSRQVRMSIVMPTFNRPEYVQANVDRLVAHLAQAPDLGERLRVLVIDNGRNLALDRPTDGRADGMVRVVPNPNLGGAGGFARGLRILRDEGWATHALFMDDDVRFEPEAVERAIALLSFATDPMLCIHGSMLSEDDPSELFEAGSKYHRRAVYPLEAVGQRRDLSSWVNVLRTDLDKPFDYAAWWFFAFPLALTPDNPLPMFVRGDDITWGLLHAGANTVTASGVCVWHQDFHRKLAPSGWFYETRNFALADVLVDPGYRWWHLERRFLDTALRPLLAFKYDTADRVVQGMEHFLAGPERWLEVDHARLHDEVRAVEGERIGPLPEDLAAAPEYGNLGLLSRLGAGALAVATLGGNLLPARLRGRPPLALPVQNRGVIACLGRDSVVYRHETLPEGFLARRDRRRFFALLGDVLRVAARLPFRYRRVAPAFRQAYPRMVSDDYWNRQFTRS